MFSCKIVKVDQLRWNFETGLEGWSINGGNAFNLQPIIGRTVFTSRAAPSAVINLLENIGGDYWDVPYPTGFVGSRWIGTAERRGNQSGQEYQGDQETGELISPVFELKRRYIHFLIGGGADINQVGLKVEVQEGDSTVWTEIASAAGNNSEIMERKRFDLNQYRDKMLRIVIYDHSSTDWGHINVDDIWISNANEKSKVEIVWGLADSHCHPMAHLAYGGNLVWGHPEAPPAPCSGKDHGTNELDKNSKIGSAVISTLEEQAGSGLPFPFSIAEDLLCTREFSHENIPPSSSSPGYLTWKNKTHQAMYLSGIRRAYEGGLRLMVAEAVNSRAMDLGTQGATRDPEKDSESYIKQINYMRDLVNRNPDWMEIALTPDHARRIIRENKLAVILGIEVDAFADCDCQDQNYTTSPYYLASTSICDLEKIKQEVKRMYESYDVRQIHVVHITDNAFAGAAIYNELFYTGNFFINNRDFDVMSGINTGIQFRFNNIDKLQHTHCMPAPRPANLPIQYLNTITHANKKGLTYYGHYLIDRLQRLGMIIGVDHMSELALDEVLGTYNPNADTLTSSFLVEDGDAIEKSLAIVDKESRKEFLKYSTHPVAMTHTSFRELTDESDISEISRRADQRRRVMLIGGIISPGVMAGDVKNVAVVTGENYHILNTLSRSSVAYIQQLVVLEHEWVKAGLDLIDLGVPLSTDFNGLYGTLQPRFIKTPTRWLIPVNPLQINPVKYAHYSYLLPFIGNDRFEANNHPSLIADQSLGRQWDYNHDGLAHYGMLPDFLQDLTTIGVEPEKISRLFLGAEAYIQMWERAVLRSMPDKY
ncbi:MAG: hypothetical protein A2V64_04980 [Bacteroidetes bacterium RBG_13_43_22]|nr:MAG: hypothetical protein A2V64_04980 [Bacteroidetes bacterium RBG_13_43_22]